MTRTRFQFIKGDLSPYFITATTQYWLPLFSNPEVANIAFETLRFLQQEKRVKIYAYCLMENHLHLILSAEKPGKEIGNFKSFVARKCIDYYKENGNQYILKQLRVQKVETESDRDYQFWQMGVHPKRIQDRDMLIQKVEYIHQNPVKRGYVDLPEHWRYSSARNYAGSDGLLDVCLEW